MKHTIPDEVLRHHTAVLGKTGSGKTSTEKLIIEQVVASGARVCVLDTLKSDWWGITSSASGKAPGLPFQILGGPRGHVPLHSSAGKVIGQLVGTGKLPLSIVDMADFEPGGIQRFFVDFAQSLWKNVRGVVYLVIEEAHEIAPKERAGFGAENMAIHWAKKLATGSRTKGIKLIVATQRVQALHNAVLGSCETLIAHRLTMDADQGPVLNWLKNADKAKAAEVGPTLASLPTGTGWICSGEAQIFERVAFPKFKTFDNTATPDSDAAEVDVKTAAVDEAALRTLIGEEVTKAEADDPKKLRAEIDRLKRELAAKPVAPPAPAVDVTAVRDAAYITGISSGRRHIAGLVKEFQQRLAKEVSDFANETERLTEKALDEARAASDDLKESASPAELAPPRPIPKAQTPRVPAPPARSPSPAASGDGSLSRPQLNLLRSLAWWQAMGHDNPSRPQVAAIAGWKITSGHLKNVIGSLNSAGLTVSKDGHVALTEAGAAAAPEPDMALTLVDGLRAVLTTPQKQIFECLLESGQSMSRADIARAVGWEPTSGHLKNAVGSMRTLEIIDYPSGGMVELQGWVLG